MSIPYAIPRARGQYRAGKISAREYLEVLRAHGYTRPAIETESDSFRSLGEITRRVMEKIDVQ